MYWNTPLYSTVQCSTSASLLGVDLVEVVEHERVAAGGGVEAVGVHPAHRRELLGAPREGPPSAPAFF